MTEKKHDKPVSKRGDGPRPAELDRDIQQKIGEGLRAMYDDIVKQGVPDRFAELLSKLDETKGRDDKVPNGK